MRHLFQSLRLLLAACLLTACTPARTGIIGNTLTTNVKPGISITGQSGLTVESHGRMRPRSAATTTTAIADFTVDYAFFTDADDAGRFAYAAIVRIDAEKQWYFQPPRPFDEAFQVSDSTEGGFHWSAQLLRVASDKDWANGLWMDMGGDSPTHWLAKRWVTHLNDTTRAIMEYREPWPEGMNTLPTNTLLLTESAAATLQAFIARADAAFLAEKKLGEFNKSEQPAKATTPRVPMDIARMAGTIIDRHNN